MNNESNDEELSLEYNDKSYESVVLSNKGKEVKNGDFLPSDSDSGINLEPKQMIDDIRNNISGTLSSFKRQSDSILESRGDVITNEKNIKVSMDWSKKFDSFM